MGPLTKLFGPTVHWKLLLSSLIVLVILDSSSSAPLQEFQELEPYYLDKSGCFYNFEHYNEGDRIMTNEPCLNCTCHNRMLMCYLRVCPFTKAIGQNCTVEKSPDQCCPIITCPEVPVQLLTSTTTSLDTESSTDVGFPDTNGCTIEGRYFADGARVPLDASNPCEVCYCIKNRTACCMVGCTLHIAGCAPVYQHGSCCPVKYDCDDQPFLDYDSTPANASTTPSGLLLTTPRPNEVTSCVHNGETYLDGSHIKMENACENCYCMRGKIACAVHECDVQMDRLGHNCIPLPPPKGQCCPDVYQCDDGNSTLVIEDVPDQTTVVILEEEAATAAPMKPLGEGHSESTESTKSTEGTEESNEVPELPEVQTITNEIGNMDMLTELPEVITEHPEKLPTPEDMDLKETPQAPGVSKETKETDESSGLGVTESLGENVTIEPAKEPSGGQEFGQGITEELGQGITQEPELEPSKEPEHELEHEQESEVEPSKEPSLEVNEPQAPVTDLPESSVESTQSTLEHVDVEDRFKETTKLEETGAGVTIATGEVSVSESTEEPSKEEGVDTIESTTNREETGVSEESHGTEASGDDNLGINEIESQTTELPNKEERPDSSIDVGTQPEQSSEQPEQSEQTESPEQVTSLPEHSSEINIHENEIDHDLEVDRETKYTEVAPELPESESTPAYRPEDNLEGDVTLEDKFQSLQTSRPDEHVSGEVTEAATEPTYKTEGTSSKPITEIEGDVLGEEHSEEQTTSQTISLENQTPESEGTSRPEVVDEGSENENTVRPVIDEDKAPEVDSTVRPVIDEDKAPESEGTSRPEIVDEEKGSESESTLRPVIDEDKTPESESESTSRPVVDEDKAPEDESTSRPVIDEDKAPEGESTFRPVIDTDKAPESESTSRPVIDEEKAPESEATSRPVIDEDKTSEMDSTSRPVIDEEKAPESEGTSRPVIDEDKTPESTSRPVIDTDKAPESESTSRPVIDEDKASESESTSRPIDEEINKATENLSTITETSFEERPIGEPQGIPGEGACLVDGITYLNNSDIPIQSKCQSDCKCLSSITVCSPVKCPPAPKGLENCIPSYEDEESCCPIYSCDGQSSIPIESDSHMMENEPVTEVLKETNQPEGTTAKLPSGEEVTEAYEGDVQVPVEPDHSQTQKPATDEGKPFESQPSEPQKPEVLEQSTNQPESSTTVELEDRVSIAAEDSAAPELQTEQPQSPTEENDIRPVTEISEEPEESSGTKRPESSQPEHTEQPGAEDVHQTEQSGENAYHTEQPEAGQSGQSTEQPGLEQTAEPVQPGLEQSGEPLDTAGPIQESSTETLVTEVPESQKTEIIDNEIPQSTEQVEVRPVTELPEKEQPESTVGAEIEGVESTSSVYDQEQPGQSSATEIPELPEYATASVSKETIGAEEGNEIPLVTAEPGVITERPGSIEESDIEGGNHNHQQHGEVATTELTVTESSVNEIPEGTEPSEKEEHKPSTSLPFSDNDILTEVPHAPEKIPSMDLMGEKIPEASPATESTEELLITTQETISLEDKFGTKFTEGELGVSQTISGDATESSRVTEEAEIQTSKVPLAGHPETSESVPQSSESPESQTIYEHILDVYTTLRPPVSEQSTALPSDQSTEEGLGTPVDQTNAPGAVEETKATELPQLPGHQETEQPQYTEEPIVPEGSTQHPEVSIDTEIPESHHETIMTEAPELGIPSITELPQYPEGEKQPEQETEQPQYTNEPAGTELQTNEPEIVTELQTEQPENVRPGEEPQLPEGGVEVQTELPQYTEGPIETKATETTEPAQTELPQIPERPIEGAPELPEEGSVTELPLYTEKPIETKAPELTGTELPQATEEPGSLNTEEPELPHGPTQPQYPQYTEQPELSGTEIPEQQTELPEVHTELQEQQTELPEEGQTESPERPSATEQTGGEVEGDQEHSTGEYVDIEHGSAVTEGITESHVDIEHGSAVTETIIDIEHGTEIVEQTGEAVTELPEHHEESGATQASQDEHVTEAGDLQTEEPQKPEESGVTTESNELPIEESHEPQESGTTESSNEIFHGTLEPEQEPQEGKLPEGTESPQATESPQQATESPQQVTEIYGQQTESPVGEQTEITGDDQDMGSVATEKLSTKIGESEQYTETPAQTPTQRPASEDTYEPTAKTEIESGSEEEHKGTTAVYEVTDLVTEKIETSSKISETDLSIEDRFSESTSSPSGETTNEIELSKATEGIEHGTILPEITVNIEDGTKLPEERPVTEINATEINTETISEEAEASTKTPEIQQTSAIPVAELLTTLRPEYESTSVETEQAQDNATVHFIPEQSSTSFPEMTTILNYLTTIETQDKFGAIGSVDITTESNSISNEPTLSFGDKESDVQKPLKPDEDVQRPELGQGSESSEIEDQQRPEMFPSFAQPNRTQPSHPENFPGYPAPGTTEPEDDYDDESQASFGPGTCRYGGKVYVSAQQIPRDDPCDFCFCFRSDIICLQQSCPPPIHGCHEEPISGFCCPRYECPVSMATVVNITTTTTTTTTTLPPHFPSRGYKGAAVRRGCEVTGKTYKVGEIIKSKSGPCLQCICGGDGQMQCDPKPCSPQPLIKQMMDIVNRRRR